MPFKIIRDDITKVRADAVVNSTNADLIPTGGADLAIHRAAGPNLAEVCEKLAPIEIGGIAITYGYEMPCRYIIHTLAPVWRDGEHGERDALSACYDHALEAASRANCRSIAFPLIGSGSFAFPKGEAIRIATERIAAFLEHHDMLVLIVVYDRASYTISERLYANVQAAIDYSYVKKPETNLRSHRNLPRMQASFEIGVEEDDKISYLEYYAPEAAAPSASLDEAVRSLDESFSQMLLRKIDELGMTDPECYKRANIDAKHFSKIRRDPRYRPKKETAVAFAIALRLPPDEARELLKKAGYALSRSSVFDVVIDHFLNERNYDIYEINEALFRFDQRLLGA